MYFLYLLLAAILFFADYFSKIYITKSMRLYETIPLIDGVFHITYVRNTGAAWSIFSSYTFLLGIFSAVMIIAFLLYIIIKKPKNHMLLLSLTMIVSGGGGNLYDRLFYKYVVDFFDFRLINFPVFNVADIFVVCGAILLVTYILFFEKRGDSHAIHS